MVVRNPLRESTDIQNDSVLDGDGADVKTSVLDEDEVVADINDEGDIVTTDDDVINESGGEDTGEDLESVDDSDLDALLNEGEDDDDEDDDDKEEDPDKDKDDADLKENSPIDNFGNKKAAPFTADDAKEARAKKEAQGDEDDKDKGGKKDEPKDGKGGKDDDGEDDKDDKDLKEDFEDPAEVLDPTLYVDEDPIVEDFGEMPDVAPEYPDEPILELEGDDEFIPEVDIDAGVTAPVYEVDQPFILPESRKVVVSRGDKIYYCGKAQKNLPSFAESTFAKGAKMLAQSKKLKGSFMAEGKKSERVALIGRSCLVEVARDWRLPGTDTIFEKGDIIQIVSKKHVTEKEIKVK